MATVVPGPPLPGKKKVIHNNLKYYTYLPLKKNWEHLIFFMSIKLNFGS